MNSTLFNMKFSCPLLLSFMLSYFKILSVSGSIQKKVMDFNAHREYLNHKSGHT